MITSRKWPKVDILEIHTKSNTDTWNRWLTVTLDNRDIKTFQKVYYGLQVGMTDLAASKMASSKYVHFFIRLTRSIEQCVKVIYREHFPSPLDDVFLAKKIQRERPIEFKKLLVQKRSRDHNLEKWFGESRF